MRCDAHVSQHYSIQRLHPRPRPATTQGHRTIHPPTRKKSRSSKSCLEEALGGYTHTFYSSHLFLFLSSLHPSLHYPPTTTGHLLSPRTPGPTDRVALSRAKSITITLKHVSLTISHRHTRQPPVNALAFVAREFMASTLLLFVDS